MQHWEDIRYQTIKNAAFKKGAVVVTFENDDEVKIDIESVSPFQFNIDSDINIDFSPYDITVENGIKKFSVSWDKIRVITDPVFGNYLARKAEEQAQLVGVKIKKLRERKNIKSVDLAERANVSAHTISRIEKGQTDVGFVTLKKILAAMGYSLADLAAFEIEDTAIGQNRSLDNLIDKLSKAGVEPKLLLKKIIPASLQGTLIKYGKNQPDLLLDEVARYISKIYNWPLQQIWSAKDLTFVRNWANEALFKKTTNADIKKILAYSNYAHAIANILLKCFPNNDEFLDYPQDYKEFRQRLISNYDEISVNAVINSAWDMGIAVLPLSDTGIFHGAAWNIHGRHVIVLKQNVLNHARWLFDALHELYHVFDHLFEDNSSLIEMEEVSPMLTNESVEELEANSFANHVLFNGDVESYAQEATQLAHWKVQNLKMVVSEVASKYKIRADSFANYMAYRLSMQNRNWWPHANSFQITEPSPREIATNILKQKVSLELLDPIELDLLLTAIK